MAYVNRPGNIDIWYDISGAGEPLVLLHGFTLDSRMWEFPSATESPLAALQQQFRVIRIDARGHGKSSSPATGYYHPDRVADILAVLDHLGIAQAHLAGFSMGGSLALGLALAHPDRVRSLTLVGSGAVGWSAGKKLDLLTAKAQAEGSRSALEQWCEWSIAYSRQKGREDIVDAISAMIREHSGAPLSDPMRGKYPPLPPALEQVGAITIPVLIQVGSDDRIFVPLAHALHEKISGSRLSVFEGSGHLLTMEEPARWVREIVAFIDSVSALPVPKPLAVA